MSSTMTVNQIQIDVTGRIEAWLTAAGVTIDSSQIKAYETTPDTNGTYPNWAIVGVIHTATRAAVIGESDEASRMIVRLYARLNNDPADAEASRLDAERWLNDAEETIVRELKALSGRNVYIDVKPERPRRDPNPQWYGKFRSSYIPFLIEAP